MEGRKIRKFGGDFGGIFGGKMTLGAYFGVKICPILSVIVCYGFNLSF